MTRRLWCVWAVTLGALGAAAGMQSTRPILAAAGPADPGRPPRRLADTGLYAAGEPGVVDPANRFFAPQYPLWSDGMTKRRWIHLPPGSTVDATNANAWDFPVGTRLWKEFSLNGRKVETRMLWKASGSNWTFASYVWNEDGTDAVLAPDEGVPGVVEVAPGRRHSIPAAADCVACHGTGHTGPLGFTALQLSTDRDPNAIHGEPLRPEMLTLRNLLEEGRLEPMRSEWLTDPPRIRTSSPATRAVLGYLAANCAMCHNGSNEIAVLGPSFDSADLLTDGDAVARSLIDRPSAWQVPGQAPGTSVLVHAGAPDLSALLVRMRSRSPSSQMPPLGTVVRDQLAVDAIARWVAGIGNR